MAPAGELTASVWLVVSSLSGIPVSPKEMGKIKHAAMYIRVSTKEQAEKGWSVEGQYKDIMDYCDKQEELKISRVYKDEGYSGKDIDRPGLETMINHAILGKFDILLCYRYDRLSRDNMDFQIIRHYLNKSDIKIVSVTEPIPETDSPLGEFMVSLIGLISTLERKWIISRSKMGLRIRAQKGLWKGGTTPYGYDYDKDSGKLVINDDESRVVKLIYDKYLEYQTLTMVANYLNNEGISSKTGKDWSKKVVSDVLKNRSYLGYYLYKDIEIESPEIQIIDNELFDRVAQIREERKVLSPNLGGKYSRISKMDKDELSFGYMNDPDVNEYMSEKASMPLCPRCNENLYVIKHGIYRSNRYGELQQYYCKPCHYEFKFTPQEPKLMIECLHCNSGNVVRDGIRTNKKGKKHQMYECKDCGKHFK